MVVLGPRPDVLFDALFNLCFLVFFCSSSLLWLGQLCADLLMSGNSVWVSGWGKEEVQDATVWGEEGGRRRSSTAEVKKKIEAASEMKPDGNTTVTAMTAAASTTTKCIGLDWESSSNDGGP